MNPEYLALEVILLFVGVGSYYWGIDRFAIQAVSTKIYFTKKENQKAEKEKPITPFK